MSAFAVVLLHTNAYIAGQNNISLVGWNVENFINVITRFSVPCFVMLSGAFVLHNDKNADYKYFYLKSFYKIAIPLIVFSAFCVLLSEVKCIISGDSILGPILELLKGDFNNYWFMFMLIGLYALAPIIIRIKKSISNKAYCIVSFIWLIFSIISQSTSTYSVSYSFGVVFSFVSYFVIGNVIYENFQNKKYPLIYIFLSIVIFVLTFIYRAVAKRIFYLAGQYSNWFSPAIVCASILLFIGFNNIEFKKNLNKISSTTYFIYLFHTKVYLLLVSVIGKVFNNIEPIFYIILVSVLAFIISYLLSIVYMKIWSLLERKFNWKDKWYTLSNN